MVADFKTHPPEESKLVFETEFELEAFASLLQDSKVDKNANAKIPINAESIFVVFINVDLSVANIQAEFHSQNYLVTNYNYLVTV